MTSASDDSHRNANIHGLRGIACSLVLILHALQVADLRLGTQLTSHPMLASPLLGFAAGVDMFFMISGYLIVDSLVRHDDIKRFLINRLIRIFPLVLILETIVFALDPFDSYRSLPEGSSHWGWFAANLLFLPGLFLQDKFAAIADAWSLSYEAAFYAFCASAYFIQCRMTQGKAAARAVLLALGGVMVLSYSRSIFFLIGAAVYFLEKRQIPAMARITISPAVQGTACGLFILLLGVILHVFVPPQLRAPNPSFSALPFVWFAAGMGFLFYWPLVRGKSIFNAVLRHPALQFLGTISYSFYLIQAFALMRWCHTDSPFCVMTYENFAAHAGLAPTLRSIVFVLMSFALTTLLATISYHVIERQSTRWLKWLLLKRGDKIIAVNS